MSSPVKHYGRWRIRWIDADGKRRSEVYIKHRDAELALQRHEVEAEETRRGLRPKPLASRTYGELADYWLEDRSPKKRSEKDDKSIFRKHLRPAFGSSMVSEVTVARVDVAVVKRTRSTPLSINPKSSPRPDNGDGQGAASTVALGSTTMARSQPCRDRFSK